MKSPQMLHSDYKDHVTIMTCIRADGRAIVPTFIYKGITLEAPKRLAAGLPPRDWVSANRFAVGRRGILHSPFSRQNALT